MTAQRTAGWKGSKTLTTGGGYFNECGHAVRAWVDDERVQFRNWKQLMESVCEDCFGAGAGAGAIAVRDGTADTRRSSAVWGDMKMNANVCILV